MTETELLAALFDWEPSEPCQRYAHDEGGSGCQPHMPGTHIVLATHGITPDECAPSRHVVCIGHVDWIRVNRDKPSTCPTCHAGGPLRRFLQIEGPVTGSDWTGTAGR